MSGGASEFGVAARRRIASCKSRGTALQQGKISLRSASFSHEDETGRRHTWLEEMAVERAGLRGPSEQFVAPA